MNKPTFEFTKEDLIAIDIVDENLEVIPLQDPLRVERANKLFAEGREIYDYIPVLTKEDAKEFLENYIEFLHEIMIQKNS